MILNKYIDMQCIAMLFFPVFAKLHSRRTANFLLRLTPIPYDPPFPVPLSLLK
jgi:hypothetical protein